MKETIDTIIKWHTKTFPDATLEGQKAKWNEEVEEYKKDQTMQELADMFIVACGIARFDSVVALEYFSAVFYALNQWKVVGCWGALQVIIDNKMKKNRRRIWNKTAEGQYHHENGIED